MLQSWLTVLAFMHLPSLCFEEDEGRPVCCYLSWIANRGVRGAPHDLLIDVEEMAMPPSQPIVGIDSIGFTDLSGAELKCRSIAPFMACFPNVIGIDFTSSKQLRAFQRVLQKPLQVLTLQVSQHEPNDIGQLVKLAAPNGSLQELHLTELTRRKPQGALLLKLLTSACHQLKVIDLQFANYEDEYCPNLESAKTIATLVFKLCMSSKNCLEKLIVHHFLMDDLCDEVGNYKDSVALAVVLQDLASKCPRLHAVTTDGTEATFANEESTGRKVCDFIISEHANCAHWLSGYYNQKCLVPIRQYACVDAYYRLCWSDLAACGGQHLLTLHCAVNTYFQLIDFDNPDDIRSTTGKALLQLFASCPNLTSLTLARCNASMNSVLVTLHTHCPNITSLELFNMQSPNEASIVTMLSAYEGKLTSLILANGANLSNAKLVTIAELFPGLQRLGLYNTSSTAAKNLMAELISVGKLPAVQKIFWKALEGKVIEDRIKSLQSAGRHPLPEVCLLWS